MALAHGLHAPKHFNLLDAVAHLAAVIEEKRERYSVYRQTLAELDAMSDRDLSDIGIARVSIRDIARQAAYGK
ncbi:DUF1127 domain-containing protein [Thioclava sp. A2]|uniref:DUF1127 domain-containing protein n=1 Tax=Thioclava sp. FCG-A2 TaxID=3080562 RepID=UPI002954E24D|nr:DUF1127 domain-containing protein [Thioclava sp. A2]MDV7270996.1 DUF1127 domain-containing protein [Thioclava sp. A2]